MEISVIREFSIPILLGAVRKRRANERKIVVALGWR